VPLAAAPVQTAARRAALVAVGAGQTVCTVPPVEMKPNFVPVRKNCVSEIPSEPRRTLGSQKGMLPGIGLPLASSVHWMS
jgi:hypothetical protein